MQLFYSPLLEENDKLFTFDKLESKHIIRVLRKTEGDILYLTNGRGIIFTGNIIDANDKKCQIQITSIQKEEKPRNYHLHIAIAPTKRMDRLEWFIEKATEIGIDEITPLLCANSERRVLKLDRLEKIMVAAAKQSLKYHFPVLNELTSFNQFVKKNHNAVKLIAHCEETDRVTLKEQLINADKILILIGPEGDFNSKEISSALEHQFIPLSLGASRLRTETAGVVACATVSVLKE